MNQKLTLSFFVGKRWDDVSIAAKIADNSLQKSERCVFLTPILRETIGFMFHEA